MPLISWSVAKSVTQALVGIAVRRGLVDIEKPMGNPRWAAGDPRATIPWRMWLTMVDGQAYDEIGRNNPIVRLGHTSDTHGFRALGDWVERVVTLFPDVTP